MIYDDYWEVKNDKETYQDIAQKLKVYGRILIGWTDGEGSHFDILFVLKPDIAGTNQGGIKEEDLFVSIMRVGAFAFKIFKEDIHYNYYGEKLNMGGGLSTIILAELINGIRKELNKN